MNIKSFLLTLLLAATSLMRAQSTDLQFWENIYVEKSLFRDVKISINHEGRVTDNVTRFSFGYLDAGLNYRVGKHVRFAFDYVFAEKHFQDGHNSLRHQLYADAVLKYKIGQFVCYDRQMIQEEVRDIHTTREGRVPDWYLRNKLTIRWNMPHGRFIPYVAEELYYHMQNNDIYGAEFNRVRFFGGVFYTINKVDMIEAYTMLEKHFNINYPDQNYILGIGFQHSFY